jgi:dihydrolipoamide dehydrogenase
MVGGIHYLMKKNKITELHGWGTFVDAHSISVTAEDGSTQTTSPSTTASSPQGATTKLLPRHESLSANVITYKEQILADALPSSIIIGGSGAIGTEFAYVLNSYGVDVTIVEFLDRMVPNRGRRRVGGARQGLQEARHQGAHRHEGASRSRTPAPASALPWPRSGRRQRRPRGRQVLCRPSASRRALEGYGLENTGVALTERGAIAIDDFMRTNVPGIYAIGDCTGKMMLAHTAEAQGVVAAETIAGARNHGDQLRHDPAGHLLPAADRLPSATPNSRPRTRASTSRCPSSRSRPTARPGGWEMPSAS